MANSAWMYIKLGAHSKALCPHSKALKYGISKAFCPHSKALKYGISLPSARGE